MMKLLTTLIALISTSLFIQQAHATNAIGVVLGDPTGVSGRMSLDANHSIEGALAFTSSKYDGTHIHGTYLWDRARSFASNGGPIDLYYGLGIRLISIHEGKYDGDIALGPRAPLGLIYNFNNPNLELFGEISLALDIAPKTDVDLDVGIGLRVRF